MANLAASTKWLLPDNSASALVVDVEVTSTVSEPVSQVGHNSSVLKGGSKRERGKEVRKGVQKKG